MLPVYFEGQEIADIEYSQLPGDAVELHTLLTNTFAPQGCTWTQIYDVRGKPIAEGPLDMASLNYAVAARSSEKGMKWAPIKVTLRQTDRKGHILSKHPFTTLGLLQQTIMELTGVPVASQELLHQSKHLNDTTATIDELGFSQSSMLHLIDMRMTVGSPEQPFALNVQPAQSGSQPFQIEVSGGFSVQRLKECVAELFGIPLGNLLLTYCSMILEHDDATLIDYQIVPGAFINALNEKKCLAPKGGNETFEVKLKETTRVVPLIQDPFKQNRAASKPETPTLQANKENVTVWTTQTQETGKCTTKGERKSNQWTANVIDNH